MGMEWRRGSMGAWLLKKKSGSAMMRMRQYNKRFFTIDFDSRVFFYTHTEASKKVSSVVRFSDIIDVQLPNPIVKRDSASSQDSETKRGSFLSRSFSMTKKDTGETKEQAHHVITVVVRTGKSMELLCSSASEAEQWHQGFTDAMMCGRECGDAGSAPTAFTMDGGSDDEDEADDSAFRTVALAPPPGDSGHVRSADRVPTGAVAAAAMAAATAAVAAPTAAFAAAAADNAKEPLLGGRSPGPAPASAGYPQRGAPPVASDGYGASAAPIAPLSPAAAPQPVPVAETSIGAAPGAFDDDDDDAEGPPVKPPVKGTFLDFTVEPAEPEALPGPPGQGEPIVAKSAANHDADTVEESGIFQASDFGFGGDEDSDSSGSAVSTPREGAADTFAGLTSPSGSPATGAGAPSQSGLVSTGAAPVAAASAAAGPPAKSDSGGDRSGYGDKQEGMTMAQRLANLEFSDDEEYDEDDPLGLKNK